MVRFSGDVPEFSESTRAWMDNVASLAAEAQRKPGAVKAVRVLPNTITGEDPARLAHLPGDRYVMVELTDHDVVYYVRAATTADGPAVVELSMHRIDEGPITRDDLRRVPTRRLAAAAARVHVNRRDDHAPGVGLPDLTVTELVSAPEDAPKRKRGRPGRTAEELMEVARIAEEARGAGLPMHKAVASRLHMSESTARRAIQQATDAGYRRRTKPSQKPRGGQQ